MKHIAPTREQGIGQEATLYNASFWRTGRIQAEVKETLDSEGDRKGVAVTSSP